MRAAAELRANTTHQTASHLTHAGREADGAVGMGGSESVSMVPGVWWHSTDRVHRGILGGWAGKGGTCDT